MFTVRRRARDNIQRNIAAHARRYDTSVDERYRNRFSILVFVVVIIFYFSFGYTEASRGTVDMEVGQSVFVTMDDRCIKNRISTRRWYKLRSSMDREKCD